MRRSPSGSGGPGVSVVVVGASHIGALKLAYDQAPEGRFFAMDFYGLAGRSFAAIAANEAGIGVDLSALPQPERPRSLWTPIDRVIGYDEAAAFAIMGKTDTAALVSIAANGRARGYSDGYLLEGLRDLVRRDRSFTLAAAVQQHSVRPTVFMTAPMPTHLPPDTTTPPDLAAWDLANRAIALACETSHLRHLPQPEKTLADAFTTIPAFARGAKRLGGVANRPTEDGNHMNADYGAIALAALDRMLLTALDHQPVPPTAHRLAQTALRTSTVPSASVRTPQRDRLHAT